MLRRSSAPGARLNPARLRRAGFRIRYINFSRQPDQRPDVSRYNGLIVLGERVGNAAAGSTVDVLMLDRRR